MAERRTRIGIAGAGNVGRSVAQELLDNGHKVLLIERERRKFEPDAVPDADWLFADACELTTLQEAGAETCDVLIAATGDDKANLVVGLLAKSEFGVPRVVARINEIRNEWLFTQAWGIDVAVSTPGAMVAGVEGAIDVGHLVRLMGLRQGQADLAKLTLPEDNPLVGQRVGDLGLPPNAAMVTLVRSGRVLLPTPDEVLEAGDEMLFVSDSSVESSIRAAIHGIEPIRAGDDVPGF
ncbi:putative potassium uptake protein [Mycobacterium antarcticum]|uniref:potassium channel family protein n=1 Tax=unclassified Mycolicibacterium TaxID=2636767 RepID=UPI0023A28643|nr:MULTISPECIES: TrkA family potassium uptake protein [unclassified Mycolicibacterium]BDX34952.1 putative potassium uptake protein [Mycolicibacterium sp. TUM20985]GLP78179.1 putative potassium uptake protein [Mycolicibacterium sp. TUM20983]GLP81230.1 putative potassium uptake protein [Mycolicibacterium sp. TUM20984]